MSIFPPRIWKLLPKTSEIHSELDQKLEYVSQNGLGSWFVNIFQHPFKNPSKYGIPRPIAYQKWLPVEVLLLESALKVWKYPFQVHLRSDWAS